MARAVQRRKYDASGRQAQAAETREKVIEAATRLFAEQGYAPTSIAQIAAAAGVSAPTVFAGFRTKVNLFARVLEVAIVGDDEPVPLADRPPMRSVHEAPTFDEAVERLADAVTEVAQRAGPIMALAYAAADADPQIADLVTRMDAQRLAGATRMAGTLAAKRGVDAPTKLDRMRDTIWLLISIQQWDLLVRQRQWPIQDYRTWLRNSLRDLGSSELDNEL
jgi:AcrR family transcriptional regulator